jgi:hypothetical protein
MNSIVSTSLGRRGLAAIGALLLSACAGLGNRPLTPGLSTLPEVVATMGQPAMTWKNADGSQQLAFAAARAAPRLSWCSSRPMASSSVSSGC